MQVSSFQRTTERVLVGTLGLPGELKLLAHTTGVVIFSHGSGSSRLSSRNQFVARTLQSYGLGTLLFDLLTDSEAQELRNVFDIGLLGSRIMETVQWLGQRSGLEAMPIGLFGTSTGAAAALMAAAHMPARIGAVVSRSGRPDLAKIHLPHVRAPTLLIVGSKDTEVVRLNRSALHSFSCPRKLEIVSGATQLFEEPGALDEVANLAGQWFENHLSPLTP